MNKSKSFNSFEKLYLKGEHKTLIFGESNNKSKDIRRKIIKNFYKNKIRSKL